MVSPVISKYFDLMIKVIQDDEELFDASSVIFKEAITHEKKGTICTILIPTISMNYKMI